VNILFYFSHPAQYLFLRQSILRLKILRHNVTILIKTKDVLESLLIKDGLHYLNILHKERRNSMLSFGISLFIRSYKILVLLIRKKPDLLIGTDAAIAQLGKLLNINRITVVEDDYEVIKILGKLTYPFTETILCPQVCSVGRWTEKKIGYDGYMKLGYLHPNVFKADNTINKRYNFSKRYVLIRLAKLTAHHDFGINGIDNSLLDKLIRILEEKSFQILISSEGKIESKYNKYLLKIDPSDIHSILAFASIFISDSQSMSVEASMLGVPSLRYSDFSGKISVLEELEDKYELTFGYKTDNDKALIIKLNELLNVNNLSYEFQKRRNKMLNDKIDVTAFLVWFIDEYPKSLKIMKINPMYQNKFRKGL